MKTPENLNNEADAAADAAAAYRRGYADAAVAVARLQSK